MSRKNNILNMTEGNPTKLLLGFALPMLLGNLFQQLYNMVDCIIVGKFVSANALAAVGATGSLNFLFFTVSNGIGNGVGIVAAQQFGAGSHENVKRAIANSVYVVGIVAVLMSILGAFLAEPILKNVMATPEAYVEDSITYMQITCGLSLAVVAYNAVSALLRALGDSKTPLVFLIVSSFVNIALDFVFVLGLHMEVAGVALATVVSQMVAAIGSLVYACLKNPYFKIERTQWKPNSMIIRRSFALGVPIAMQGSLIAISCVALQRVVNEFGPVVGAANTAIGKIEQLVQQPFSSLCLALSNYTGQNLGAGKLDRVKKGFRISTTVVLIISAVMLLVGQQFGRQIIGIFVSEREVIALGAKAIRINSLFYFMLGMIYVTRGVLNGAGDNTFAMLNGITELVCRVGLAKPLTMIPAVGKWGIWLTTGLTWFITGVVNYWRYAQGSWQRKWTGQKEEY